MEKLAETKKRSGEEMGRKEEPKEKIGKWRRSNGTDAVNYLRERAEIEQQYREQELEIKTSNWKAACSIKCSQINSTRSLSS